MNEQISEKVIPLTLENYKCSLYLPQDYNSGELRYPVIYLLGESNILPIIQSFMSLSKNNLSATPTDPTAIPPDISIIPTVHSAIPPDVSVIPTEAEESPLTIPHFLLLGIETQNWETDFTPWEAPPLNKKSPAFTGGASTFLELLSTKIKPYIDKNYRTLADANDTSIIGYSLAGLTTLYALYTTHFANNFASCSGSLWYKHWISYIEGQYIHLTTERMFNGKMTNLCETNGSMSKTEQLTNVSKSVSSYNTINKQINNSILTQQCLLINNRKLNIYLSLGNAEKNSRHLLMSQVETCTLKTIELLKQQFPSAEIFFEYNNGGHFTEVPTRIAKAIIFLQNAILNKNKDSL